MYSVYMFCIINVFIHFNQEPEQLKGKLQRSSSFKQQKKSKEKKQQERLTRSQSMRFSEERANDLLKAINSSTAKGKEKGKGLTDTFIMYFKTLDFLQH